MRSVVEILSADSAAESLLVRVHYVTCPFAPYLLTWETMGALCEICLVHTYTRALFLCHACSLRRRPGNLFFFFFYCWFLRTFHWTMTPVYSLSCVGVCAVGKRWRSLLAVPQWHFCGGCRSKENTKDIPAARKRKFARERMSST